MKVALLDDSFEKLAKKFPPGFEKALKWVVHKKLKGLSHGFIEIDEGNVVTSFGDPSSSVKCRIQIHNPKFYTLVALEGSIGAGESYIHGYWDCDNLTNLIRIFILNRESMTAIESGWAKISYPFLKIYHSTRKNTVTGSSNNIEAHYDLGNDFFSLFLDETMTYSCGIFANETSTMKEASIEKYDRICRKLKLNADDHIIEIGTGWGSFAIHAVQNYGCRVTTTTISKNQYSYARERVEKLGLSERIKVQLKDYRLLEGQYDKLVSIEMIEAVGHEFYQDFFKVCSRLLKDDGQVLIQAITIRDQIYDAARRSVDFIQRFIFPGSCIPSILQLSHVASHHTDLNMIHLEDITQNYPPTLRYWRDQMKLNEATILKAGYPPAIIRMWNFYLAYCEGGFIERNVGDVQMMFAKSGWRGNSPLGDISK